MGLDVSEVAGRTVVRLQGPRLDAAVAGSLKQDLIAMIDQGAPRLLLDFSAVDFLDSSGLGAVVGVLKHMGRPGGVELACLSPAVLKVFNLTRMSQIFPIHEQVPGA